MKTFKPLDDIMIFGFRDIDEYLNFLNKIYRPKNDNRVFMGKAEHADETMVSRWLEIQYRYIDHVTGRPVLSRMAPMMGSQILERKYRNYRGSLAEVFSLQMSGKDLVFYPTAIQSFKTVLEKLENPEFIIVFK